tara:strand:- start:68 stop:412 length:345 start_codon:yes stop_codon:yes gene_type:complete
MKETQSTLEMADGAEGPAAPPPTACQRCSQSFALAIQYFLTCVISVIPGVNDPGVATAKRFGFSNGFEESETDDFIAKPGVIPERVTERVVAGRFLLGIFMIDTLSWGIGKTVQ